MGKGGRMSAHTPGTWAVSTFDGPEGYGEIVADGFLRVCSVPFWPCASDEMEANARLVAAAPELLEALKWAIGQVEDDLDPDHQAAMDAARAAIAKAEGGGGE
jgi:hypothetical protein